MHCSDDVGPDGLAQNWRKTVGGANQFRVVYRAYMDVETGGAPLRIPRKIRIYAADGMLLAVLGIGEFQPWRQSAADVNMSVDPGTGLRFQPLQE